MQLCAIRSSNKVSKDPRADFALMRSQSRAAGWDLLCSPRHSIPCSAPEIPPGSHVGFARYEHRRLCALHVPSWASAPHHGVGTCGTADARGHQITEASAPLLGEFCSAQGAQDADVTPVLLKLSAEALPCSVALETKQQSRAKFWKCFG